MCRSILRRSAVNSRFYQLLTLIGTVSAVLPTATAGAQQTQSLPTPSASVEWLQNAIARRVTGAEPEFWRRVKLSGTPLVERNEGDTSNIRITFVWRGDTATRNVALVNTAVASPEPARALLIHVPGSDVWYRTYDTRSDARFPYELSVNDNLIPFDSVTDWRARTATFRTDPFNPRVFHAAIFGRDQSYFEGPRAPSESWLEARPGVTKGRVQQSTFPSKVLGNARTIWVYTPPGYDTISRTPKGLPLLVAFDGGEYVSSIPTPTILDNLIAAKRTAPLVAIFVGNPEGERDAELGANDSFVDFIVSELVPWARSHYNISSTPAGNVIAGSSLGGFAAAFVATRHPEIFGNVLSQSGAYSFSLPDDPKPELLPRTLSSMPRLPIRFYVEAGVYETGLTFKGVDLLSSNRHLREVLTAKGYDVRYSEFAGGHSDLNWRSGFVQGLLSLIGLKTNEAFNSNCWDGTNRASR